MINYTITKTNDGVKFESRHTEYLDLNKHQVFMHAVTLYSFVLPLNVPHTGYEWIKKIREVFDDKSNPVTKRIIDSIEWAMNESKELNNEHTS